MTTTHTIARGYRYNPSPLGRLIAPLLHWNNARRTRNILSRLSTQELDDIGLTRGDIARVAGARY